MGAPAPSESRWKKGQSGNPTGKAGAKTRTAADMKALARAATPLAMAALLRVLRSNKTTGATLVAAAVALLDRGWGKPVQAIEGDLGFSKALEAMEARRRKPGG
jgi:hypothetical protein